MTTSRVYIKNPILILMREMIYKVPPSEEKTTEEIPSEEEKTTEEIPSEEEKTTEIPSEEDKTTETPTITTIVESEESKDSRAAAVDGSSNHNTEQLKKKVKELLSSSRIFEASRKKYCDREAQVMSSPFVHIVMNCRALSLISFYQSLLLLLLLFYLCLVIHCILGVVERPSEEKSIEY